MNLAKFLLLAFCGLALRLWLVPQWADVNNADDNFLFRDQHQYDQYAANLVQQGVFSDDTTTPPVPNARRTPVYPWFLALIYYFTPKNHRAVQIAQAIIDMMTCWLVYRTARELFRDRLVGYWSFGTALIAPPLMIFTGYIMAETMATFWTTLAVFCALKGCRDNRNVWFIGLGLSSAMATLTRPVLGLLPVFLVISFFLTREGMRFFTSKRATLAAICGLLIFLPWGARNWIVLHEFNLLSGERPTVYDDNARGYHRWISTWIDSQNYTQQLIFNVAYQSQITKDPTLIPSLDKYPSHAFDDKQEKQAVEQLLSKIQANVGLTREVDDVFRKLANEKIRSHPIRHFVILPLYRMLMLWTEPLHWFSRAGVDVRISRFAYLINMAIVAFGFGGLWVIRHHWRDAAPLWLAMIACTIGGVLTCFALATVNPRLVAPAYPQMCIFASACAFHLTRAKSPLKTSTEIYEPDYGKW